MRLPVGISDFKELITAEDYFFADKSLLIEDIINDGSKVLLITRPRRFGKTLNLSMLKYFFDTEQSCSVNLFEGLKISKNSELCKKYQNKYPVIFISFKDVRSTNYNKAYLHIIELIRELYENYRYLLEKDLLSESEKKIFNTILNKTADVADIETALKRLASYLLRKHKTPAILLIDEYDTPIQEAYLKGYYNEMINLMRGMLGDALKDNNYLYKAVLTGITRISQESMFSGLNNINVYSLLREKYGQYFGFTETEVNELMHKKNVKVSLNSIKEWYNGYQVGKHILYNPWSIINCLDNDGALKPYWLNTSSNELIAELITVSDSSIKQQFEDLLQRKIIERPLLENLVFKEITKKEGALWSLLLCAGYLKVLSSEFDGPEVIAKLAIPNKEVGFAYERVIRDWFTLDNKIDAYKNFISTLINGNVDLFKQYISSYLVQSASYFDFNERNPERVFHVFILGLVVGLREYYNIQSNREIGFGRCDVVFIPKDIRNNGIILEFKMSDKEELLNEKAKEALQQIREKEYTTVFKPNEVKEVLCIGISFCGKKMDLVSEKIYYD